jgi:hypothetical protein
VPLQFVGLAEALELTLLLAEGEDARYERAALRWHARFVYETKNVDIRESVAVLALFTRSRRTDWRRPRWPSSSASGEASSDAPRLLFAGRVRRRTTSCLA